MTQRRTLGWRSVAGGVWMRGLAWCLVLGLCVGCGASERNGEARASGRPAALSSAHDDAAARAAAQLAPRLARSRASLSEVVHPDGRRSLRVNGSFSQAQIARVTASGAVETECVDSVPAAERALRGEGAR